MAFVRSPASSRHGRGFLLRAAAVGADEVDSTRRFWASQTGTQRVNPNKKSRNPLKELASQRKTAGGCGSPGGTKSKGPRGSRPENPYVVDLTVGMISFVISDTTEKCLLRLSFGLRTSPKVGVSVPNSVWQPFCAAQRRAEGLDATRSATLARA